MKKTATAKVRNEIALKTNAWRMNGMSRLMRKNSMMGVPCAYPLGLPDLPDGHALELLLTAIPEVDQASARRTRPRTSR